MELDFRTLQMFHRMAREGVDTAASRLNNFTGMDAEVTVTRVQFVTEDALQTEFYKDENLGVNVNVSGGITGKSSIVFDHNAAQRLTETVINRLEPHIQSDIQKTEDSESLDGVPDSVLTELGHMMNCGFIDGWANVLNTAIDVSPPTVGIGTEPSDVFGDIDAFGTSDIALVFQSRIDLSDTELTFKHYLFPEVEDLNGLLRDDRDTGVQFDYEKLLGFDEMVKGGAEEAAETMTNMTGHETELKIRNLNFVPIKSIPRAVSNDNVVGVGFSYRGLPSGYLIFVFNESSAAEVITRMIRGDDVEEPFEEMGKSALQELGNIMASGIIDCWANVLQTGIDHSTPTLVRDDESAIMDSIIARVGQNQDYAFLFDTHIVSEIGEFDCKIYSICNEGELEKALAQLDMENVNNVRETPSFAFDEEGSSK